MLIKDVLLYFKEKIDRWIDIKMLIVSILIKQFLNLSLRSLNVINVRKFFFRKDLVFSQKNFIYAIKIQMTNFVHITGAKKVIYSAWTE